MSLQRTCYLCAQPVSIRRRMSVFCSERCEARYRYVHAAGPLARPASRGESAPSTPNAVFPNGAPPADTPRSDVPRSDVPPRKGRLSGAGR